LDVIETAEALLNVGKAEFAAGRVYYAMFPCTARHIVPETERVGGQVCELCDTETFARVQIKKHPKLIALDVL
jgi:hypothetical protein